MARAAWQRAGTEHELVGITVQETVIRLAVRSADSRETLVVHAPGSSGHGCDIVDGVSAELPACDPDQIASLRPLAEALALERNAAADAIWDPARPLELRHEIDRDARPRRWLTYGVLLYLAIWLVSRMAPAGSWRHLAEPRALIDGAVRHAGLLLVLAGFVLAAVAIPEWVSLHDHNSFVARADCARDWSCDRDPRFAWCPGALHAWGLALSLHMSEGPVLFYDGSTLHSFLTCEIREGLVPENLNRPVRESLNQEYELVPVRTFTIPTAQHPAVYIRLLADRRSVADLGFYWMRPRPRSLGE